MKTLILMIMLGLSCNAMALRGPGGIVNEGSTIYELRNKLGKPDDYYQTLTVTADESRATYIKDGMTYTIELRDGVITDIEGHRQ